MPTLSGKLHQVARTMTVIYHLITEQDWSGAQEARECHPESLRVEGFVHCSRDVPQMLRVAQRLYPGRRDLLALELDTMQLHYPVISEPSRSGEMYPHIYGPLETAAVIRVWRVQSDADGNLRLTEP